MALGPLRALALDINFGVHGVPATVTRPFPDDVEIATTVIWVTPTTDDMPGGEFSRREQRRVIALKQSDVPTVPRGTLIVVPPTHGAVTQTWRVDGISRVDGESHHAVVIPEPA